MNIYEVLFGPLICEGLAAWQAPISGFGLCEAPTAIRIVAPVPGSRARGADTPKPRMQKGPYMAVAANWGSFFWVSLLIRALLGACIRAPNCCNSAYSGIHNDRGHLQM